MEDIIGYTNIGSVTNTEHKRSCALCTNRYNYKQSRMSVSLHPTIYHIPAIYLLNPSEHHSLVNPPSGRTMIGAALVCKRPAHLWQAQPLLRLRHLYICVCSCGFVARTSLSVDGLGNGERDRASVLRQA